MRFHPAPAENGLSGLKACFAWRISGDHEHPIAWTPGCFFPTSVPPASSAFSIFHTHTSLSHTIFVTHHISHTSHIFVAHHLSHTYLSHTICHTHLSHTPSFTHLFVALVWQAWHLAASTFVLRGRCGTWRHPPSLCLADVALMPLGWVW